MDSAIKNDEEKKEHFDKEDVLDEKCKMLADMIRISQHFIAFTGAGISTSTGIPDFRSGQDTVLKTGPGVWEKQAKKIKEDKKFQTVSTLRAVPSTTHMALVQLERYGILKYLISQNTDGLHRRSGFPSEKFAELHGNTNMEKCQKCGKKYMRDFRTRTALAVHDHKTERKCDNQRCNGDLYDSIINFGENLPQEDMENGFTHSQLADLCLVLGTSLRVTPAADMPKIVGKAKKNLVIVNLQQTPLDHLAVLKINGLCDDIMKRVLKNLEIDIPEFILQRRVAVQRQKNKLSVRGEDMDGGPYQIFKQIVFDFGKNVPFNIIKDGPYDVELMEEESKGQKPKNYRQMALKLGFFEHYKEGVFRLDLDPNELEEGQKRVYLIEYSPQLQKWFNMEILKK